MGRRRHRQISGRPSRTRDTANWKVVRRETVARFDVVARRGHYELNFLSQCFREAQNTKWWLCRTLT